MRDLRIFPGLLIVSAVALAACGDDTGGAGGGGGAGGAGGGSTTGDTTTATATGTGGDGGGGTGGDDTTSAGGAGGGGDATFQAIWEGVAFPDDGGRADIEAFEGITVQVRAAGTEDVVLELADFALGDGAVGHAYAIGLIEDDSLDALVVLDNDEVVEPTPGTQNVRFAHLAPDAPAVDLYLVTADEEVIGPLFEGDDFFAYPAITTYGELDAGSYGVLVVEPGGAPEEAIAEFEGLEVADGGFVTIAAAGLLEDDSFTLVAYDDDLTAPAAGSGAITFVHAAPDAPAVDVGVLLPE